VQTEQLAQQDHQVLMGQLVLPDLAVLMVLLDRQVQRVLTRQFQDQLVLLAQQVQLVLQAQQEAQYWEQQLH
jgi:hypothetical protein